MNKKLVVRDIDVYVEGEGKETIVMIHGWPDTYRLWDAQVENLKKRYTCVRFTLPGFDINKPRKLYTLKEEVDIFSEIIDTVSPGKKVILMLHDWGCFFGYQYYMNHKNRVSKIVGVDVGDVDSKNMKLPFNMIMFTICYQLFLAAAWHIGGKIGDGMTRWLAGKLNARTERNLIWSGMNYGYHLRWKSIILHKSQGAILFDPASPMLFLYGTRKPTMFHSSVFVDRLNKTKGSKAVGFEAGHWVMLDKPEAVSAEISAWLS